MSRGKRRDTTSRARVRRVLGWTREGALTVAALAGVTTVVVIVVCAAMQVRPLVFMSGSMRPTIDAGALAFAQRTPIDELRPGDIVSVVTDEGSRVTHRLVAIDRTGVAPALRLKGDANPIEDRDAYIVPSADRVLFSVPHLGRGMAFISSQWGLFLLGVGVTGLLVYAFRPGLRRRGTRVLSLSVVPLAVALAFSSQGSTPTYAWFSDTGAATSGSLETSTMPKPEAAPTNACSVNNPLLGAKTITTRWVVASPPSSRTFSYTARLRETGTNLTVTVASGIASATVSTGVISLSLGQTYHIDVTVSMAGTQWTANSTREAVLGLLGLGWSCGSWS